MQDERRIRNWHELVYGEPKLLHTSTVDQILHWIEDCESTHELCHRIVDTQRKDGERPRRLIKIRSAQDICLQETMDLPIDVRYATLSHRWGNAAEAALWRAVVVSPGGTLSMATAPQILHDVALLLSQLSIPYLWIDALCIDQDSETDWLIESAKMGQIYSNGYLNISAVAANNATEGLFPGIKKSANLIMQVRLRSHMREVQFSLNPTREWLRQVEHAALSRRGWVLQERLLSPRIVHFGEDEVFWECVELAAGKITPTAQMPEGALSKLDAVHVIVDLSDTFGLSSRAFEKTNDTWRELIKRYSKTNLTKPSDKIVAISGLADKLSTHLKIPPSSYIVGLWKHDFVLNLLWTVRGTQCYPERAPSWSWVRWDGSVTFTTLVEDISRHAYTREIKANHSGDPLISSGASSITIQAPLVAFNTKNLKQLKPMEVIQGILVPSLDTQNMAKAKIPYGGIQFDDSSYSAPQDGRSYFLLLIASFRERSRNACYGLILTPTGRKKGQFERVGLLTLAVTAIKPFVTSGMDPSNVPTEIYSKFDPENGFEVELV